MNIRSSKSAPVSDRNRAENTMDAYMKVDFDPHGLTIPKTIYGNFLEHLGFSTQGGIWAQELSNPVFSREVNLLPSHITELLQSGRRLIELLQNEGDPSGLPLNWTPDIDITGFGVAALDDATSLGIPFPWAPIGEPGSACASMGRIGGAVRLIGTSRYGRDFPRDVILDNSPSGIRQGIFLPVQRCLAYNGHIWMRVASLEPKIQGKVEVGFRRRSGRLNTNIGEILDSEELLVGGCEWKKYQFHLNLPQGSVIPGEPVDFYLRWLSGSNQKIDLLVDQVFLFPSDAIEGFDPDIISLAKKWPVPLLRWPGGNFVSQYHWRDGVGNLDNRPTRPNTAWYGLEYNFIGTREFIHFCRLIDAEPQITVNTGTGTPEEAAAWVEFCNGEADTPMGRLRADQGDLDPYHVKLWEVGNEIYGCWQVGNHGADENARIYVEFAHAMHSVDPSIELIATGNSFDFAEPGPAYDYTHADQRWHQKLIELAGKELNLISLHCLPVNDRFLERISNEDSYYSLLAQLFTWENTFLPDLLHRLDDALPGNKPVKLAITEWGILGIRQDRPYVNTFGEAIYAALFLNMMVRNANRIPIANATALLHGGCIRKVAGRVYTDPQYLVIQQYAKYIGAQPLKYTLEGPEMNIETGTDLGRPERNAQMIDAIVCLDKESNMNRSGIHLALVNVHLHQSREISITLPHISLQLNGSRSILTYPDPVARATFIDQERFHLSHDSVSSSNGNLRLSLPACSVTWLDFQING